MTIRRQPADFLVIERPSAAFTAALTSGRAGAATHAVYELTKESLGTPEAVQMFAKHIGARGGKVDYAGLKDKHARTTQLVSLPLDRNDPPAQLGVRGWSAKLVGWSEQPVTADVIDGNRFEIVVRDLSKQQSTEMGMRAGRLSIPHEKPSDAAAETSATAPTSLLVMNYFGAQRFGSARHGAGFLAPLLMRGEFEGALKLSIGTPARKDTGNTRQFTRLCATHWGQWKKLAAELPRCPERRAIEALANGAGFDAAFSQLPNFTQQMSVEAYQSHLWNSAARKIAERMAVEFTERWQREGGEEAAKKTAFRPVAPLRADDEFGVMLFPTARMVDATWRRVIMPVLGPKTELKAPWAFAATQTLKEEGIQQENLRIPGLRRPYFGEADRALFAVAEGFEMSEPKGDDMGSTGKKVMRTVKFSLGRGAYATVVLRALGQ